MTKQKDLINPDHYKKGGFEVIDVIEAYELGFNLGNVIKYILRAGEKEGNPPIQDLEKAKWYLEREISNLEKNEVKHGLEEIIRQDEVIGFTDLGKVEDFLPELSRKVENDKKNNPWKVYYEEKRNTTTDPIHSRPSYNCSIDSQFINKEVKIINPTKQ